MPTDSITRIAPSISVAGQLMSAAWYDGMVGLRVQRGLNVVGRATLRFVDPGYERSTSSIFPLGTKVRISTDSTLLLAGIVTGASLEQVNGQPPELVVTVDDLAVKLGLTTKAVAYEKATFSSVIQQMVGPAGLSASVNLGTTLQHEYLQQRSTDLVFLNTLMRRANGVWWVDDATLHVEQAGTSKGSLTVALDGDLLDFSVRASGLRPLSVDVNGWDAKGQADVKNGSYTPKLTADSTFVGDYTKTASTNGLNLQSKLIAGEGNPALAGEADELAGALATLLHADAVVARGTSIVNGAIVPLVELQVSAAGPASGKYVVSEVEHIFSERGFFTRFVAGPVRTQGLVDTLGDAGPDSGFSMPHLTTGLVSQVDDPDKLGRVRVKYNGAGGQLVSNWARVVSLGGGSTRGSYFLPELQDEVLLGFERGDVRRPVVLGGLFSSQHPIAGDDKARNQAGDVQYRRVTSRLGHVLELADGQGPTEQHILLKLGTVAHKIRLGADEMTIDLESGKPFTLKAGNAKIAIDNAGNITIEGASIKLNATQQGIQMQAQMDVKASATAGNVSLEGLQVEAKGKIGATLQSSAMTAVKGNPVMIN